MEKQPDEFVIEFRTSWVFDAGEWENLTPELAVELAIDNIVAGDMSPWDGVWFVNGEAVEA